MLAVTCHELKQPILNALARLTTIDGKGKTALEIAEDALIECAQKIDIILTSLKTLYTDNKQPLVTLNANECIIDALADYAVDEDQRKKIVFELHKENNFFFKGETVLFNHIIFCVQINGIHF